MTPSIVEIRVYCDRRIELVDYDGKVHTYSDVHDYEIDGSWVTVYWGRIVQAEKRHLYDDYKIWHDGCITIEEES